MDGKNLERCQHCSVTFEYAMEDTFWIESSACYSAKVVKCPTCGEIVVIKYVEDESLDVNLDDRYFDYSSKNKRLI